MPNQLDRHGVQVPAEPHRYEVTVFPPQLKKLRVLVKHWYAGMLQRKMEYSYSDTLAPRQAAENGFKRFLKES